jgi:hypothetical protein
MSATVAHSSSIPATAAHLTSGFGLKPTATPTFFSKLSSFFWTAVEIMHEAHEEERKAHAHTRFTAW